MRAAYGWSCSLVIVFPIRTTWSLTLVHVPDEDRTWLLMPIVVLVSSEDLIWSLTFVCVPISSEDSLKSSVHFGFVLKFTLARFRKGDHKGEDNVTDITTVMSRFELLTSCIIIKSYVFTEASKYNITLYIS